VQVALAAVLLAVLARGDDGAEGVWWSCAAVGIVRWLFGYFVLRDVRDVEIRRCEAATLLVHVWPGLVGD
jgi:hypothetical protein